MYVDLETYLNSEIYRYFLVLTRISAALLFLPALGERIFSARVRLALALGLTWILTPLIPSLPATAPSSFVVVVQDLAFEVFAGSFFGLTARLLHTALAIAGQMIGRAIVLANIFTLPFNDNGSGSILGAFLTLSGVMLIFATDVHHLMIAGLIRTYDVLPSATPPDVRVTGLVIAELMHRSYRIAAELSAPLLVLNFVFYVGLGIMTRLMPRLPIFFIALPAANLGGLIIFLVVSGFILTGYAEPLSDWLTTLRL